ncbi:MAG TPA: AI-2E family transporter [Solirubrobacteraceae bacterium]|jgi:predicted PurR-regulated permease PerM
MSGVSGGAPPAAPPVEEERKLTDSPEASPTPEPPRVIVPRWVQLVLLPLALLALWALAKAAGKVLVIFIVAALIALILNPPVAFLQRRARLGRGLAVLTVYLAFFLTLAGIGVLLANPISNQAQSFAHSVPSIVREANKQIVSFQHTLNKHGLHVELVKQGKTALQTLQEKLVKSSSSFASFGGALLSETVAALFDLVLVFVLSVYMLVYGGQIGTLVRRTMPDGDGTPADDYPTLVQHAITRYVGGQLLFSLIMGTTAGVALYLFGVLGIFPDGSKYAVVFGIWVAFMELIPYIGPILGALLPISVALFTDPVAAVWVALLFLGLQQLEGHIVAPQIFGHTLRINPLLVILALLFGQHIYGLVGALVALPILSIVRETTVYLSRHLKLESWDSSRESLL